MAVQEKPDQKAHSTQSPESNTQNQKPTQTECAKCSGTGYVAYGGRYAPCECQVEKLVALRIPLRYQDATLLDFSEGLRADVIAWIQHPTDGLFITGNAGRGKTHLACAIVRTFIEINRNAKITRAADFYYGIREAMKQGLSERALYADMNKSEVYALDDIGSGGLSDFQRYAVVEFLDLRMNANLHTIVTTNWSLEDIATKMDERIASRLSSFQCIGMDGPDRRFNAAGEPAK